MRFQAEWAAWIGNRTALVDVYIHTERPEAWAGTDTPWREYVLPTSRPSMPLAAVSAASASRTMGLGAVAALLRRALRPRGRHPDHRFVFVTEGGMPALALGDAVRRLARGGGPTAGRAIVLVEREARLALEEAASWGGLEGTGRGEREPGGGTTRPPGQQPWSAAFCNWLGGGRGCGDVPELASAPAQPPGGCATDAATEAAAAARLAVAQVGGLVAGDFAANCAGRLPPLPLQRA